MLTTAMLAITMSLGACYDQATVAYDRADAAGLEADAAFEDTLAACSARSIMAAFPVCYERPTQSWADSPTRRHRTPYNWASKVMVCQ